MRHADLKQLRQLTRKLLKEYKRKGGCKSFGWGCYTCTSQRTAEEFLSLVVGHEMSDKEWKITEARFNKRFKKGKTYKGTLTTSKKKKV